MIQFDPLWAQNLFLDFDNTRGQKPEFLCQ
jgi:hypothetical protein